MNALDVPAAGRQDSPFPACSLFGAHPNSTCHLGRNAAAIRQQKGQLPIAGRAACSDTPRLL